MHTGSLAARSGPSSTPSPSPRSATGCSRVRAAPTLPRRLARGRRSTKPSRIPSLHLPRPQVPRLTASLVWLPSPGPPSASPCPCSPSPTPTGRLGSRRSPPEWTRPRRTTPTTRARSGTTPSQKTTRQSRPNHCRRPSRRAAPPPPSPPSHPGSRDWSRFRPRRPRTPFL